MKAFLPALFVFFVLTTAQAQINQNAHLYIPLYQQLADSHGDIQQHGNGRALVWHQISSEQESWDNVGSAWKHIDSIAYSYTTNGKTTGIHDFNYATGNWADHTKQTYTYDLNGNQSTRINQSWVNYLGNFRNTSQTLYTFDANNNNTLTVVQNWDTTGNVWVNSNNNSDTYNANHKITDLIAQNWNAGTWVNAQHDIVAYDGNGNQLSATYQSWNAGTSNWINGQRDVYTYDANNNKLTDIAQTWSAGTSTWTNTIKESHAYDVNGNQTQYMRYYWDTGSSAWVVTFRYTYINNSNNKETISLREDWNNTSGIYENTNLTSNSYNPAGDLAMQEFFVWSTANAVWTPEDRYTLDYDNNRNQTYDLEEGYNTTNLSYENLSQFFYTYQDFGTAGISDLKNELQAGVYPNPANQINLSFSLDEGGPVTINVFDLSGRALISQTQPAVAGTNNVYVQAGNLATGNYFIQLINGTNSKSSVLKFVKD